jgi:ParB/RepB/Spo0J family partition protein
MTKMTMTTTTEFPEEKVHQVPIDKIEVDRTWNSRKYLGDDDDSGVEAHSFFELVESLKTDGQDTPVDLKQGSDGHYFLIAGFRRFAAFQRIYKEDGTVKGVKPGHIKAFIKDALTEVEALLRNGRENTGRENLNMADTAYLIHRLSKHGLSEVEIASRLALTQSYVNQLHRVYKGTIDLRIKSAGQEITVFEHWREAPGRIGFGNLLELVRINVDPRIKELKYLELLSNTKMQNGKTRAGIVKTDMVMQANGFGTMLGRLEKAGLIQLDSKPDWKRILETGKRLKFGGCAPEYIERVVEGARQGFERGRTLG